MLAFVIGEGRVYIAMDFEPYISLLCSYKFIVLLTFLYSFLERLFCVFMDRNSLLPLLVSSSQTKEKRQKDVLIT